MTDKKNKKIRETQIIIQMQNFLVVVFLFVGQTGIDIDVDTLMQSTYDRETLMKE